MLSARAYFWDLRWFWKAPADWPRPRKQPKSRCTIFDVHFLSGWWKANSRHFPTLLSSKHSSYLITSENLSHFQCALTIAQVQRTSMVYHQTWAIPGRIFWFPSGSRLVTRDLLVTDKRYGEKSRHSLSIWVICMSVWDAYKLILASQILDSKLHYGTKLGHCNS